MPVDLVPLVVAFMNPIVVPAVLLDKSSPERPGTLGLVTRVLGKLLPNQPREVVVRCDGLGSIRWQVRIVSVPDPGQNLQRPEGRLNVLIPYQAADLSHVFCHSGPVGLCEVVVQISGQPVRRTATTKAIQDPLDLGVKPLQNGLGGFSRPLGRYLVFRLLGRLSVLVTGRPHSRKTCLQGTHLLRLGRVVLVQQFDRLRPGPPHQAGTTTTTPCIASGFTADTARHSNLLSLLSR